MSKKKQAPGELIYGINPIVELLKAKRRKITTIYTTRPEPKGWQRVMQHMPKYPIPVQYVQRDVLTKMVHTTDHQGIVAWVTSFPFRKKPFDKKQQSFVVLLDGIQDPRNLGAILRSAYCTGVQGVIITKRNSSPLNAVALKASAGLAEHLEIIETTSTGAIVQELQQNGYHIYVTSFNGKNAAVHTFEQPACLVLGSEGDGVSPALLKVGTQITLPQRSNAASYNVSVAAGICFFVIAQQFKLL